MALETLELWLLIAGWVVAFLFGKELAVGYRHWRAYRARPGRRPGARD